jgi:hypothetical protein
MTERPVSGDEAESVRTDSSHYRRMRGPDPTDDSPTHPRKMQESPREADAKRTDNDASAL